MPPVPTDGGARESAAILSAVASFAQRLVRAPHWRDAVPEALRSLGEATQVSRAYLFERIDTDDVATVRQRFEWTAPDIEPQIDNPDLQRLPMRAAGFARWDDAFRHGEPIQGRVADFPGSERALLEAQGIASLIVVPVTVDEGWWGFIGFDHCVDERPWSSEAVEALQLAAGTLGGAVERQAAEQVRAALVREQSARTLAEAERSRLLELFSDAPAMMALLEGPDLIFTLANEHYVRAAAKPEVLGKPAREVFPELTGPGGLIEVVERVYETGEPFTGNEMLVSIERLKADGSGEAELQDRYFSFVYQAFREPDGHTSGVFVHGVDVTEHVESRRRIDAERGRLQQIIDALPEAIAIGDERGGIVMSNAAARAIWGQDPGPDVDVTQYERFGAFRPDGSPWPSEELPAARAVLRGEMVLGEQMLLRNMMTGELLPLLVNSAPLSDESGRVNGAVTVFQDISALKELDRQKEEFLATIAHDLKGPLTTIKGHASLLRRRVGDDERIVPPVQEIDDAVTVATEMLDELLDIARLQMGRPIEVNREPTDLVHLANRVVERHRTLTEQHVIELDASEPELVGAWDPRRLQRALANLVENAIKYSPDGGSIRVQVRREGDQAGATQAVLTVTDEGIGIGPSDLSVIFDRFRRGGNVGAGVDGMGIGLAAVKQIVEQHGGSVEVQSEERKGSTFTLRLPLD